MILNKPKYWDKKVGVISIILLPFTLVFLIVIFIKKKLIKPKKYNIPIICVGNIYIGGTGKTPTSILLANELQKLDHKPVILRKYYKTHSDEYDLIKKNFKDLIVANNRVEGIKRSLSTNFDSVILDDGFQDYSIKKDLSIICFNQNQLIGNGMILPSGPLRESLNSLKKANIILINGKKNNKFEEKVLRVNRNLEIFYSSYKPINLNEFRNKKLLAIAGIGNPENFFQLIEENNLRLEKRIIFPDHHKFSENEIQKIINESKEKNYQIIMTEKDFFKVKNFNLDKIKYLKISLEIDNKEKLINKIKTLYVKNF